ncbi:MAG: hypothetical protein ACPGPF_01885 [Pontibacterium sp.]
MLNVLKNLETYSGAEHSAVSWKGALIASTCPAVMHKELARVQVSIRKLLDAARDTSDGGYREIHMLFDRNLIVGYQIADGCVLLLVAKKGANLALLATAARNARVPLLKALRSATPDQLMAAQKEARAELEASEQHAMTELMSKLSNLMVDHLGSEGAVSFYSTMNDWKQTHGNDKYKLPALLKQLAIKLPTADSREQFLSTAVSIVRSYL